MKKLLLFLTHHKKYLLIGVFILVVGVYIFKPLGLFANNALPANLKTDEVKKGSLTTTINASGDVQSENWANLTFLTAGKVSWLGVKEGDRVIAGQLLSNLEQTEYQQAVSKAEASLWSAQSAVDKTLDDIRLYRYTGDSKGETQTQKTTREQAQAARDAAYQDLQKAKKQLDLTVLTAPFEGVVSEIKGLTPGQTTTLASGGSITLVGSGEMKFVANVDEIDFSRMKTGLSGEVILDAFPNSKFTGVITRIGTAAAKTATGGSVIPVEMSLSTDSRLIHGLNGEVNFQITEKENVLIISRTAVHKDGDKRFVYLLEENKPVKRDIQVGDSLGGITEVISGLQEGDKVILGDVQL